MKFTLKSKLKTVIKNYILNCQICWDLKFSSKMKFYYIWIIFRNENCRMHDTNSYSLEKQGGRWFLPKKYQSKIL